MNKDGKKYPRNRRGSEKRMKAQANGKPYSIEMLRRIVIAKRACGGEPLTRSVFIVATATSAALDFLFVFSPSHNARCSNDLPGVRYYERSEITGYFSFSASMQLAGGIQS